MTADERKIAAKVKNPQLPANVRCQGIRVRLCPVRRTKITERSGFPILENRAQWKSANAAQEPDIASGDTDVASASDVDVLGRH
jgi:hypothetical protein